MTVGVNFSAPEALAAMTPDQQAQFKKLDEAAKGFEQIFVQQLLKTANFASQLKSGGYGTMAMDAMASGITKGGGMGLSDMIRDSLIQRQLPQLASGLQSTQSESLRGR